MKGWEFVATYAVAVVVSVAIVWNVAVTGRILAWLRARLRDYLDRKAPRVPPSWKEQP